MNTSISLQSAKANRPAMKILQSVPPAQTHSPHRAPEHQFPQVRTAGRIVAHPAANVSHGNLSVALEVRFTTISKSVELRRVLDQDRRAHGGFWRPNGQLVEKAPIVDSKRRRNLRFAPRHLRGMGPVCAPQN